MSIAECRYVIDNNGIAINGNAGKNLFHSNNGKNNSGANKK